MADATASAVEPVDDDLQRCADVRIERARHGAAQGRAIGVVGRGDQHLYLEPTFEPERTMPPGNGMMTSGTLAIAPTAACAAASVRRGAPAHDQEVAAADRLLGQAGRRLAQELAVHHRNAPEMLAAEPLGDLPAVAEIAQRIAEPQLICVAVEARIAGGARAGQHALADAVLQAASAVRRSRPRTAARARRADRPASRRLGSSRSIPASQPQPITEVAKPVIDTAACRAHLRFGAVMIDAVARMPKASANVSSTRTPLTSAARMAPRSKGWSRPMAHSGTAMKSVERSP